MAKIESGEIRRIPRQRLARPGYWYIASPYTNTASREASYAKVKALYHDLFVEGICSISPIILGHEAAGLSARLNRQTHEWWLAWSEVFLRASKGIIVLTLPGWMESLGVTREMTIAREMRLPLILFPATNWEAELRQLTQEEGKNFNLVQQNL